MSNSALSLLLLPEHSDSESQDEIIQNIARQLAHIGDRMDRSVPPRLVNHLAIQFMNGNLSEEVSEKRFGAFSGLRSIRAFCIVSLTNKVCPLSAIRPVFSEVT